MNISNRKRKKLKVGSVWSVYGLINDKWTGVIIGSRVDRLVVSAVIDAHVLYTRIRYNIYNEVAIYPTAIRYNIYNEVAIYPTAKSTIKNFLLGAQPMHNKPQSRMIKLSLL